MDIDAEDTVLRLWCAKIPARPTRRRGDWLCVAVVRGSSPDAGKLEAEYRFRWHAGPGFSSPDEKNFYQLGPVVDGPAEREQLFTAIRRVMESQGFENRVEREINGDAQKFIDTLKSIPGFDVQLTAQGPKA